MRPPQVRLYVEGGGDSEATHTELRRAFTELLRRAGVARLPRTVACGGRTQTLDDFRSAVEGQKGSVRAFLLVDSEDPVAPGATVWAHLEQRDGWKKPAAAPDGSAFLMVQCMETWLVADLATVEAYFQPHFLKKHIADWPDLEAVAKKTLQNALIAATKKGKPYEKGQTSFEILARVQPAQLEARCPHAHAFFQAMRAL